MCGGSGHCNSVDGICTVFINLLNTRYNIFVKYLLVIQTEGCGSSHATNLHLSWLSVWKRTPQPSFEEVCKQLVALNASGSFSTLDVGIFRKIYYYQHYICKTKTLTVC